MYEYTRDLQVLEGRRSQNADPVPPPLATVRTPLVVEEWERALAEHPDREFAAYILNGLRNGFRVGFKHTSCTRASAKSNMRSAADNPDVIDGYLAKEVELGRVVGPVEPGSVSCTPAGSGSRRTTRRENGG